MQNLKLDSNLVEKISIDGPGFINIKLSKNFFALELDQMFKVGEDFGKGNKGLGQKVNVEYVSANPTGLLHLGHGRNACIGDSIANLYQWLGYDVTREYYFNNAGRQMQNLARSIFARYRQILGDNDYPSQKTDTTGTTSKKLQTKLRKNLERHTMKKSQRTLSFVKLMARNGASKKFVPHWKN